MKIVDRYVLRELTAPFLLGIGVFTSILLIVRILKLVEMVVNRGVPLLQILKLFSYILPAFLEVTLPMALLLAILVAFGRMSSDSEIIALRAAGFSLYRLMAPVVGFAMAAAILTFFLSVYARPWGNSRLRTGLYDIVMARASAGLKAKVFNDDFAGLVIYVERIEPPGNRLYGILVSDQREHGNATDAADQAGPEKNSGAQNPTTETAGPIQTGHIDTADQVNTVYARSGTIHTRAEEQFLTLRLVDGGIYTIDGKGNGFEGTTFQTMDINLDLRMALAQLQAREKDVSELKLADLRQTIASKTANSEPTFLERVELHRKIAIPFACLVFAALGVPLGIQPTRSVHSRGFSLSLALIFLYYLLLTLGQNLGDRGAVHPPVAVWIPNIVLAAVAAYLFSRSARDMSAGRPPWVTRITARLQRLRTRTQPT